MGCECGGPEDRSQYNVRPDTCQKSDSEECLHHSSCLGNGCCRSPFGGLQPRHALLPAADRFRSLRVIFRIEPFVKLVAATRSPGRPGISGDVISPTVGGTIDQAQTPTSFTPNS